jgi:hypothetical protein
MAAGDHLAALRRHGLRVDAALYDPGAQLHFEAEQLARERVAPLPRPLRSGPPGVHDPLLLRAALQKLFADLPEGRTGGRVSGAQQLG